MSIRHIPATEIKFCDFCGQDENTKSQIKGGRLTLTQGEASFDAVQFHVCDECLELLRKSVVTDFHGNLRYHQMVPLFGLVVHHMLRVLEEIAREENYLERVGP